MEREFLVEYSPLGSIRHGGSQYLCQHVNVGLFDIVTRVALEIAEKLRNKVVDCPFLELALPLDSYLRTGFFQGSLYVWMASHPQPVSHVKVKKKKRSKEEDTKKKKK